MINLNDYNYRLREIGNALETASNRFDDFFKKIVPDCSPNEVQKFIDLGAEISVIKMKMLITVEYTED